MSSVKHTSTSRNNPALQTTSLPLRLLASVTLHPIEHTKVLMQLGFEPFAPIPGRSIFGTRVLMYGNTVQYARHIYQVRGITGLYRGLSSKVAGIVVSGLFSEAIADKMGVEAIDEEVFETAPNDRIFDLSVKSIKREAVVTTISIILTQPFQVVSVRMIAQFVGTESQYSSISDTVVSIFRENGMLGFFSGLIPKLICELTILTLTGVTAYYCRKLSLSTEEWGSNRLIVGIAQYIFSSLMYPLQVVSNCMIVNGSSLAIGRPPQMNHYKSWLECFYDLSSKNEHKRGSSLFWRYKSIAKPTGYNRIDAIPFPTLATYK